MIYCFVSIQVLTREDDKHQWTLMESNPDDDSLLSYVRVNVGHFTQFTLGDVVNRKTCYSTLKRDPFYARFLRWRRSPQENSREEEDVFEVSRSQVGIWNVSSHPSMVYVYLLPVRWAKSALEKLQVAIGADQLKASLTLAILQEVVRGIGFGAILTGRMVNMYYDAIQLQSHTGKDSLALVVTWDEDEVSLWDVRPIMRGDCLVLLPQCFTGRPMETQRCGPRVNMMSTVISMYMAAKLLEGTVTPAKESGEEKLGNPPVA